MLGMIIFSSKNYFQGDGLMVKVTVAIFRKTLSSLLCLHLLIDFNITSHKCFFNNISSKFDFQGPGLKVKITVAIFSKNFVIALRPTFIYGF